MFINNFGKIKLEKSELNILIENNFNEEKFNEFVDNFQNIYLSIDSEFKIIADLTKVSLLKVPKKIYYKLADLFASNDEISKTYLTNILIITNNKIICNILNGFFKIYKMPHPITFENKL